MLCLYGPHEQVQCILVEIHKSLQLYRGWDAILPKNIISAGVLMMVMESTVSPKSLVTGKVIVYELHHLHIFETIHLGPGGWGVLNIGQGIQSQYFLIDLQ